MRLEAEIIGVGIVAVDVTERRQAEDFWTIAMNQMAEGLFTVDAQGLLTSIDHSAVEMLGWTSEELIGKEMRLFVLADDQDDPSIDEGTKSSWMFGRLVDTSYWTIMCTAARTVHSFPSRSPRHRSSSEIRSKVQSSSFETFLKRDRNV